MSSRVKQSLKKLVLNCPIGLLRKIMVTRRRSSKPNEIEECIDLFCSDVSLQEADRTALKKAIKRNMSRHLITPDEYFLYDFASKSEAEKDEFVGDMERTILCARLYNSNPAGMLFMDKMKTYEAFRDFFKREVVQISNESDFETYRDFCSRHAEYMVKPVATSRGKGIRKESAPTTEDDARTAFAEILEAGRCVLEEVIDQDPRIAQLHPESVNTVRYATYFENGRLSTLACFIKIGRGKSVIDNGGAGGFLAAIDEDTGIIITPGKTEFGEVIEIHPDTGVPIVGFEVPAWSELKELVAELPTVLPEQKYVGWDLALSETKGWVLVEGNSGGQFVGPQISKGQGVRRLVEATFGSL